MVLRGLGATRAGAGAAEALRRFNARHPWSHNDHFHSWIVANLPEGRSSALDVGCGRGELAWRLSFHFEQVLAVDVDEDMRAATSGRCAAVDNVAVRATELRDLEGPFDLITMVAVLHHLDVEAALRHVRRLLAPGGRFLVVGLAAASSRPADLLWDAAAIVTNPLIGYVKHPWPQPVLDAPEPFPVKDPELTFDELRVLVQRVLPGAEMRHRLGFRHTIGWTKPL
ncbi:class I SAM-dependent methyltransferase [Tessaracoccus terricola]